MVEMSFPIPVAEAMALKVETTPCEAVVVVEGDLVGNDADAFRARTRELIDFGHTRLVVSLAGVSNIDAAGMGAVVAAWRQALRAGGGLRLCAVNDAARGLLESARLDQLVDIFGSVELAKEGFFSPESPAE